MSKCECCGEQDADGQILGWADCPSYGVQDLHLAAISYACAPGARAENPEVVVALGRRIRARRAGFYGKQPTKLPETLPDGTVVRTHAGNYKLHGTVKLYGEVYQGRWLSEDRTSQAGFMYPRDVDWTQIKRSEGTQSAVYTIYLVAREFVHSWVTGTAAHSQLTFLKDSEIYYDGKEQVILRNGSPMKIAALERAIECGFLTLKEGQKNPNKEQVSRYNGSDVEADRLVAAKMRDQGLTKDKNQASPATRSWPEAWSTPTWES